MFANPSRNEQLADKTMSKPHKQHESACAVAGIDGLTLPGVLRVVGRVVGRLVNQGLTDYDTQIPAQGA